MSSPALPNARKPAPKRSWVIVVVIILVIGFSVGVPVFIFGGDWVKERISRVAFSSESWHKNKLDGIRLRMVDNLMKSRLLEGKSRDEIMALLGESDGDPAVESRFPGWQMHYYLGPSRGTVLFRGLDYDYLVLRLDATGKVIAIDIVTLKT